MARKTQLARRIITALLTCSLFTTTFGDTNCRMADVRISSSWWTGLKWTLPDDCLRLDLASDKVGDEGAAALAGALKTNTALTTLKLSVNNIGHEGAAALAGALKTNTAVAVEQQYRRRGGGGTGRGTQDQHRPHHAVAGGEQYRPRGHWPGHSRPTPPSPR